MFKSMSKKGGDSNDFSLYGNFFDRSDMEEDDSLYKKQLYVLEDEKFTKKEQSNLTLKHKGLLNRLILEDFSVYPLKKDPNDSTVESKKEEVSSSYKKKLSTDDNNNKDVKKIDELEKFAEDENEFIKDLHRINYLTFSPFSLSFSNKNDQREENGYNSIDRNLKEKENENKLFKMINFDYNNYEFNEDLLFNICHGFVDPDKLKEENILGNKYKNLIMMGTNLDSIKKVEEKDENNLLSHSNSKKNSNLEVEKINIQNEMITNDLIEQINKFIEKKGKISFFNEVINNYYGDKKKMEEILDITFEEKKNFYQKWLDKFHDVEVIYNNYKVQIQRTETIRRNREEKKKKEMEEERLKQKNKEQKFVEELEKIRQKAIRKKNNEEKGIINNSSMFSDSLKTITSGMGSESNFSTKDINKNKKSKKKKQKKDERFDWMVQKSDNYFAQY